MALRTQESYQLIRAELDVRGFEVARRGKAILENDLETTLPVAVGSRLLLACRRVSLTA